VSKQVFFLAKGNECKVVTFGYLFMGKILILVAYTFIISIHHIEIKITEKVIPFKWIYSDILKQQQKSE
jgi:hypothetical protein